MAMLNCGTVFATVVGRT